MQNFIGIGVVTFLLLIKKKILLYNSFELCWIYWLFLVSGTKVRLPLCRHSVHSKYYSSSLLTLSLEDLSWQSALPKWPRLLRLEVMVQGGSTLLPCLPCCSSYPVPSSPEGQLMASVISVIRSTPAAVGGLSWQDKCRGREGG